MIKPHSPEWYDRLAETQASYYYVWDSKLAPNHGEDNFFSILRTEIKASDMVLDIGCGSGEITNEIAPSCKQIIGYDRVKRFIETANKNRHPNASFLCYDSKLTGTAKLPLEDKCIDYFISSKGPLHWIPDTPRIARENARIIMLVLFVEENYAWNELLPRELQYQGWNKNGLLEKIRINLNKIGSQIDEIEFFEADEIFSEPKEFMKFIMWGKSDFQIDENKLEESIEKIFETYGREGTLVIKHNRFIWRSIIRTA